MTPRHPHLAARAPRARASRPGVGARLFAWLAALVALAVLGLVALDEAPAERVAARAPVVAVAAASAPVTHPGLRPAEARVVRPVEARAEVVVAARPRLEAVAEVPEVVEVDGECVAAVPLDGTGSAGEGGLAYVWRVDGEEAARGARATVRLGLGAYEVELEVTDAAGARSRDTVEVEVVDATPPIVMAGVKRPVLWPPGRELVDPGLKVTVVDNCDPSPTFAVRATSDEPAGPRGAAVVQAGARGLLVRAERADDGDGRVVLVAVVARDADGNAASAETLVTVPATEGALAVDSGQVYAALVVD